MDVLIKQIGEIFSHCVCIKLPQCTLKISYDFFQLYLNKVDILSTYVFGGGHGNNLHNKATTEEFSSLKGFEQCSVNIYRNRN